MRSPALILFCKKDCRLMRQPHFIPKRITEEGIKNLKDVNKTYEFYDEYREIIINKKIAQIIKENVPYAKFYPVILDNRN